MLENNGSDNKQEKAGGVKSIILNILLGILLALVTFLMVEKITEYKVQKMRNEIIVEVNAALESRDKTITENVKVANSNVKIVDKKFNDIWLWLDKDVKIRNKNADVVSENLRISMDEILDYVRVNDESIWERVIALVTIEPEIEDVEQELVTEGKSFDVLRLPR